MAIEAKPQQGDKIVAVALFKHLFPKSYRQLSRANLGKIAIASTQLAIKNFSREAIKKRIWRYCRMWKI